MYKRGQVTIFIAIGISILVLIGIVFLVLKFSGSEEIKAEQQEAHYLESGLNARITSYVEDCLEERAFDGVEIMGAQAGRIFFEPKEALFLENAFFIYGARKGEVLISKEKAEEQLADYIDMTLNECVDDFRLFANEGVKVEYLEDHKVRGEKSRSRSKTEISYKTITVKTELPAKFLVGEDSWELGEVKIVVDSSLGLNIEEARKVIASQNKEGKVDLSLVSGLDFYLQAFAIDETKMLYSHYYGEDESPMVLLYVVEN
jgi:hypothetical protein